MEAQKLASGGETEEKPKRGIFRKLKYDYRFQFFLHLYRIGSQHKWSSFCGSLGDIEHCHLLEAFNYLIHHEFWDELLSIFRRLFLHVLVCLRVLGGGGEGGGGYSRDDDDDDEGEGDDDSDEHCRYDCYPRVWSVQSGCPSRATHHRTRNCKQ